MWGQTQPADPVVGIRRQELAPGSAVANTLADGQRELLAFALACEALHHAGPFWKLGLA